MNRYHTDGNNGLKAVLIVLFRTSLSSLIFLLIEASHAMPVDWAGFVGDRICMDTLVVVV
jgi:hypothetical protein